MNLITSIVCFVTIALTAQDLSRPITKHVDTGSAHASVRRLLDMQWNIIDKGKPTSIRNIGRNQVYTLISDMLDWGPIEIHNTSVSDFRIMDLEKDGMLEIVALVDDHCTTCPNRIVVIRKKGLNLDLFEIPDDYADLSIDVRDLDGNGVYEILSKSPVTLDANGGDVYVPWIDIYQWNGQEYVKANSQFSSYYRDTYIPGCQTRIKQLSNELNQLKKKRLLSREESQDAIKASAVDETLIKNNKAAIRRAEVVILARGRTMPSDWKN